MVQKRKKIQIIAQERCIGGIGCAKITKIIGNENSVFVTGRPITSEERACLPQAQEGEEIIAIPMALLQDYKALHK